MPAAVEIVCYSASGHTLRQAEAVRGGAAGRLWRIDDEGRAPHGMWDALDASDAIVFGSPTYLGGPAWQMKRFVDETSGRWMERRWQDKLAGGFANGGAPSGNSSGVISFFWTFASQHGMIWASLGQAPANAAADGPEDRNWLGGSGGALARSPVDAGPETGPQDGDLASAHDYGRRLAAIAAVLSRGKREDAIAA